MAKETCLQKDFADYKSGMEKHYIGLALEALGDGRITDHEYNNFEKTIHLSMEEPGMEPEQLEKEVDLPLFNKTMRKLENT